MTGDPTPPSGCPRAPEVHALFEALVADFDGVLRQIDARAWRPLPNWDPDVEAVRATVLEAREAMEQALAGDWGPVEAWAVGVASRWAGWSLARPALLPPAIASVKPLVYPVIVDEGQPEAVMQRLLGLDLLQGYVGRLMAGQIDARLEEVQRDALFYGQIVDNLPSMVFVKTADELRFVRWNRAAEELVGTKQVDMLGKTDADFFPEEAAFFNAKDREVLASGELRDIPEEPIQTHRGTRYLHTKKIPIYDEQGRPAYLLGISHDITERKRVLAELSVAKERAEQADRTKGEFLARMSHEIRTPLNGIIGLTELVLESELAAEQRDGLRMVLSSAEQLLRLVNEVLNFSKLEAGKLDLEIVDFALAGLVEELAGGFKLRARAQGLELRVDLGDDLPRRVEGDPHRVRQVLANLLDNALRFTHEGSVWVEVQRAREGIRFSVGDTGIGIPPEKRELIFAPFDQADGTITRRYGGTGLGLAICRRLAEGMGGRLWVESDDGGSVFHMLLPLGEVLGGEPEVEVGLGPLPELPSLRVLLAEDDAVSRTLAVRVLEALGHRVVAVRTGLEVLDVLGRDPAFDALLLDVEMPELSGLDAARAIREREAGGPRLPIVAITARALDGDRERCLEAGMDGYVQKPIRRRELLEAIAAAVGAPDETPPAG